MSKVSTLHAAMVTLIEATLTTAARIPNAYALETNPGNLLDRGYGIMFGPTANGNRHVACSLDMNREVAVVLTRLVATTDSGASAAGDIEKDMFEDQLLLIKAFDQSPTLGGAVDDVKYISDGGIELLSMGEEGGASGLYFVLTTTFRTQYTENLNT